MLLKKLPDITEIWNISKHNFNDYALDIFHFQAKNNPVYAQYLDLIDKQPSTVKEIKQIPFLPISLFKSHRVSSIEFKEEHIFESSSTTGINTSKHHIRSLDQYHRNTEIIFEQLIGKLSNYEILGLLPSYLERKNSSLVSMVSYFIKQNKQPDSFFLNDFAALISRITASEKPVLLFGVSFALIDFADGYTSYKELTIIETGGMKGRKKEITKDQLYHRIQTSFPRAKIISEYGMTELQSQAYSNEIGKYVCPPWMKVLPRTDNDPLSNSITNKRAALNIVDLANLDSCCFVATDDLGRVYNDGSFEVLGRLDNADLRGCSLLAL